MAFSEFIFDIIFDIIFDGVKSSSKKSAQQYMLMNGSEHLSSYISACQEDPNLKSFDSTLHQRTKKTFSSLAVAENQYLPLDSLMGVYGFLSEISQDVVKTIIESNEDVWKDEELRSLVDLYFENTAKTLELINTVENCVKRAEISQLIIRFAVKQFETESVDTDLGARSKKKNKYAKTLEELNKFKAKGYPLGEEFVTLYNSIYKQQASFLEELCKQNVKLDKKQKKLKIWRILSNVMFGTALVTCIVLSIVSLGVNAPVFLVAAGLTAAPIATAGEWVSDMLKEWEKAVEKQKDLLTLTEKSTKVNNEAMETIYILVQELRVRISSILESVDFAVEREEEEEATRLAMQEIMKKVEGFTEKIQKVGENAAKCGELINSGRLEVLEHIANSKGM